MTDETPRIVNPSTLEIMLVCYYAGDPWNAMGSDRFDSEPGRRARKWLVEEGLITTGFDATERGKIWVEQVLRTPLPVQVWAPAEQR